jgi:lysophospholipid acyltransferase (LPLAT)-like uncharacterized protein
VTGGAHAAEKDKRTARLVNAGIALIRMLAWTWRYRIRDDDDVRRLRAAKRPIIFALWHGHMLPLLYKHRDEGVTVLISEHGDGEIIARIAMHYGFRTVRGSTSRGAARALLELVREVKNGNELAITPDGPRGPTVRADRRSRLPRARWWLRSEAAPRSCRRSYMRRRRGGSAAGIDS